MSLKKYLKRWIVDKTGQVFMEYVMLLVVIASLTIAATSDFFLGFKQRMNGFQTTCVAKMGSANAASWTNEENEEAAATTGSGVYNFAGGW